MNPLLQWVNGWFKPKAVSSIYESANPSPRRGQVPGAAPRDARQDLVARDQDVIFLAI